MAQQDHFNYNVSDAFFLSRKYVLSNEISLTTVILALATALLQFNGTSVCVRARNRIVGTFEMWIWLFFLIS